MYFRRAQVLLPAIVVAAVACTPGADAQQLPVGSAGIAFTMPVPDSLQAKAPIGDTMRIEIGLHSDGHRVAIDVGAPSVAMLMGAQFRLIGEKADDTLHLALILPPQLAALAKGASGYTVDVPLGDLDSLKQKAVAMVDSMQSKFTDSDTMKLPTVAYHNLGTTDVVAGLTCENWEMSTTMDSFSTTMELCLVPSPPLLAALRAHVRDKFLSDPSMSKFAKFYDQARAAFGGRELTPIRITDKRTGMHMELTSISSTAPDLTVFAEPTDLVKIPLPSMKSLMKPDSGSSLQ